MRITYRYQLHHSITRLANPTDTPITGRSTNPFKPAPIALLPPIPLYRRLFRAHRHKLPPEERILGDQYIKSEFRSHRNVDNPIHVIGFLTEWQLYAQKLEGDDWRDERMDEGKVGKLSDEQIGQLYELMEAIKKHGGGSGGESGGTPGFG